MRFFFVACRVFYTYCFITAVLLQKDGSMQCNRNSNRSVFLKGIGFIYVIVQVALVFSEIVP